MFFEKIKGSNNKLNLIYLHGLLGRGKNLRSLANGLLYKGDAYLVDLRNHGASFHS